MKFLVDEDVPVRLLRMLRAAGHDAQRVTPATSDRDIAALARRERRVLVTLDKDFATLFAASPTDLTIVHIRVHPPAAPAICDAFQTLLERVPEKDLTGFIVLDTSGTIRFSE